MTKESFTLKAFSEISNHAYPMKGSEIKTENISQATKYRVLHSLRSQNLVEYVSDGRGSGLILTEKGVELAEKIGDYCNV